MTIDEFVGSEATMTSDYFAEWYKKNGAELNAARRDKYLNDPAYRAQILRRNNLARRKRKQMTAAERRAAAGAKKVTPPPAWKTVQQEIEVNGMKVVATLFTIGALSRALGKGISTVRVWERNGILPETPYRSVKGDRLYTLDMVERIKTSLWESGRLTDSEGKLRTRVKPEAVPKWVHFSDGSERLVLLYKFGVLAKAVQRTVVALGQMERAGRLPITPFRVSSLNYRLYTVEMIEAVVEVFRAHYGIIRNKDEWEEVFVEISDRWRKLGIGRGARIMDVPVEVTDDESKSS